MPGAKERSGGARAGAGRKPDLSQIETRARQLPEEETSVHVRLPNRIVPALIALAREEKAEGNKECGLGLLLERLATRATIPSQIIDEKESPNQA